MINRDDCVNSLMTGTSLRYSPGPSKVALRLELEIPPGLLSKRPMKRSRNCCSVSPPALAPPSGSALIVTLLARFETGPRDVLAALRFRGGMVGMVYALYCTQEVGS